MKTARKRHSVKMPERDRCILRALAARQADIAALPIHKTTTEMWKRMNRLERGKPMVWITEVPWWEMDHEIGLETSDPFCREIELSFRRTLYQWEHFRADMVVDKKFYCPIVVHDTSFGVQPKERTIAQGVEGSISSHQYVPVIREDKDIEKIRVPQITPDWDATEENYERIVKLVGDILPVEKTTRSTWWFAPWDYLVQLWGVQEALTDLILRPEMVHKAMDRLVSAYLNMLDQYEKQGLLSLNNDNTRVGSGGPGFTDLLPRPGFDPKHVRAHDLWGCATAQIFSDVSPEMHWEFALRYELPWLEHFGLNYYGCCEPLHDKVHILKKIPNLRRVSMSPKANFEKGAEALGSLYVFSMKPNPAILATDVWNPQTIREELKSNLEKTRGCIVEVILKDISTVRNDPRRLWEWARIASEVAGEFA